jgi:hypothetical protein
MLKAMSLFAASEAGDAVSRRLRLLGYFCLAAFFLAIGLVFGLMCLRDYLALRTGIIEANGLIALLMIVLGLIVVLVGKGIANRRKRASLASVALVTVPLAARYIVSRSARSSIMLLLTVAAGAYLGRKAVKNGF